MIKKEYTNKDIWNMGAENTAKLLNKIIEENHKLKNDKLLDGLYYYCLTPVNLTQSYSNFYHRTSRQLKNHLKDNGFPVDSVTRSSVGDLSFYNVEFNLSNDEWKYEETSNMRMKKVLGIKKAGLVDFYKHDNMIHEVILISEKELNDKYLKDGNLEFNNDD